MLFRWLRKRRLRRRGLFPYFDGTRQRWGDPFTIYRDLTSSEVDIEALAPAVDEQKEPETTQVLDAFCKAFDVTRWDDKTHTGLMDNEILGLIEELDSFAEDVKKKYSPGPI